MIHHTEHYSDRRLSPGQLTRRIGRWLNYREPCGGWAVAAPNLAVALDVPDNWQGAFDLDRYSRHGALQIGVGDTSDPDNRALFGLRRSDQPEAWINLKAYDGVQAVSPLWDPAGLIAIFAGLWPNADVSFTVNRHRIEKRIEMAIGAPLIYRWTLREAPGVTHDWQPNGELLFRNAAGDPVFVLPAPWATDANGDPVSVTMTEEDPVSIGGHSYPVIKLGIDPAGATYPITVDPTAVISGTTDVEDAVFWGWSPHKNKNWGAAERLLVRQTGTGPLHTVARISAGSVPAGTITGFRLVFYPWTGNYSFLSAYIVAAANDWIEGTGNPIDGEVGACCWNFAKYNSQAWAGGSSGCGISGTDYDADATPPQILPVLNVWASLDLKTEWPPLWRDAIRAANGIILKSTGVIANNLYSSERASHPLRFEIDYLAPEPSVIFDFGKVRKKKMRTDFVDLDAPQTPSEGTPVNVLEYTDKTVQITGSPTGLDVVVEGTMDGTNWSALTASITAIGFETIAATVKLIRVKLIALTSGNYDVKFSGRLAR